MTIFSLLLFSSSQSFHPKRLKFQDHHLFLVLDLSWTVSNLAAYIYIATLHHNKHPIFGSFVIFLQ